MRRAIATAAVAAGLALAPAADGQGLPGTSPSGANDFACNPSAEHPYPVVLIHGTFGDMVNNFINLAPLLKQQGYCTFALDYGGRGLGPVDASADQIAAFTRRVLEATGAAKVAFVGHSQGGMQGRYVAKLKGLHDQTDEVIGLSPSNHGTTVALAPVLGAGGLCQACADQAAGSDIYQRLNAGEEAPAPIAYTNIETIYDEVVTPYTSAFLEGPAERVTNVTLQDRCPGDHAEHLLISIPGDPVASQWVLNALSRPGPANPRFEPDCTGKTLGRDPDPATAVPARGASSTPADSLTVRSGSIAGILRHRRILFSLRASTQRRMRLTAQVRVGRRGRVVTVGRRTLAGRPALDRVVRVPVGRAARRGLVRARRLHRSVTITAYLRAGPKLQNETSRRLLP